MSEMGFGKATHASLVVVVVSAFATMFGCEQSNNSRKVAMETVCVNAGGSWVTDVIRHREDRASHKVGCIREPEKNRTQ